MQSIEHRKEVISFEENGVSRAKGQRALGVARVMPYCAVLPGVPRHLQVKMAP